MVFPTVFSVWAKTIRASLGVRTILASLSSHDPSYDNLIAKALRLIRRREGRERAIAEAVNDFRVRRDEALLKRSIDRPTEGTPHEIVTAMQAPAGVDRFVAVYRGGMLIKAMIHPRGESNPEREAAVWRCLLDQAMAVREDDVN